MTRDHELLTAIVEAHTEFVDQAEPRKLFDQFLKVLLSLMSSEYGFIGEVLQNSEGQPYLKTFAMTNIAWNAETHKLYDDNAPAGMEFTNLNTLLGSAIVNKEAIIANAPSTDARCEGLPQGHPPLSAFLGAPIMSRGEVVGMVGVANCPKGYSEADVEFLKPLLLTCGNYIRLLWNERENITIESALKESQTRSQAILNSSIDAIITINDSGFIESANPAVKKMFGHEPKNLVGKKVNMLMPEPHSTHHDSYLKRYLKTGEARIIGIGREIQAKRKDGTRFPAELAITEFSIPGKQLFTGVVKDISERKIAETNLEETRRLLLEANENLLAILDESKLGVIMFNASGHIQFVNHAIQVLLQEDKESMLGNHWQKVLPLTSDQRKIVAKQFFISTEDRSRLTVHFSRDNKERLWFEIEIRDDPRDSRCKILFIYDVTEINRLRSQLSAGASRQMIGNSMKMREMFTSLNKIAMGDWTVLIEGETGVGKELVAKAIHATSTRKEGPFIAINCGGLTSTLLTSQLFGYRRGAFTGAVADQVGLFEAANGGTLFRDEIGDVPIDVQTAKLRVHEERELTRVGDTKPRKIDVRVLTATNRDLAEEVTAGRFRNDLLYRIRVARVQVPPLRGRREDIPLLVNAFLLEAQAHANKLLEGIDPVAMQALLQYDWPGNVRELKNAIDTSAIHCDTKMIQIDDLPQEIIHGARTQISLESFGEGPKTQLENALRQTGGNRSKAAKLIGVSRATFYRRLLEAGIETNKKPKS
jgi:PAS domain S-box-containing protein